MLRSFSPLMRRTKVLVIAPTHASFLLPERIFPYNDRAHSLFCQEVNNAFTGSVQVVINLPVTVVRDVFHLICDTLSVLFGKAQL